MTDTNNEMEEGLRKQIDENLKKVYQKQLEETLPDRFVDLLDKLRQQETIKGSSK